MYVTLVVGAVRAGLPVDLATRSELPQDLLVEGPQKLRAHEGLVVEAGGQEATHQLVGCRQVEAQARPHVLGGYLHPCLQLAATGANVGLVPDLHEEIRIPMVGGHDSALAVVLHGSAEHVDTIGGNR